MAHIKQVPQRHIVTNKAITHSISDTISDSIELSPSLPLAAADDTDIVAVDIDGAAVSVVEILKTLGSILGATLLLTGKPDGLTVGIILVTTILG